MRSLNLATLLFFTANGITAVVIPPYLRDLGVSNESAIGAIVSTAFFISIVVRPLGGYLGERVGYSAVMRLGAVAAVVGHLMYLIANPAAVQMGRALHGLAIGMFLPMSIAISANEGAAAMASRALAVGVGNVVGPMAGSLLYDLGGGRLAVAVSLALHTANLLAVAGVAGGGGGAKSPPAVERRVYLYMLLLALYASVYMTVSTFTPVRLRDGGLPVAYWGLFSSAAALASLAPRAVLVRAGLVNGATAGAASAVAALGLALAASATDPLIFAAAGVLYGFGQGAVVVTYQVLALAGSRGAGLASAVYTMGWDVGSIAGPLLFGWFVDRYGFPVLEYVPLLLSVNVAVLLINSLRGRNR
ncbi:MFS transporter [Pyrobaculum neutrophilum]|uniref:Major facilitator superfamily MFS_1 n=1 Tax=Pyrobaculum neutrophilum (strain DSM 2338 / JCM 9278 / NBRC 100436 / V24Sta) TaxID=444157 RepID=B1Y9F4_PYRNV|nr:MFS transporter [Pyrobaculum neutrophilum]ACB40383.1 major facilitator superfamily MFS_1 [Pyrobaculum neutrophilum V24Sta]